MKLFAKDIYGVPALIRGGRTMVLRYGKGRAKLSAVIEPDIQVPDDLPVIKGQIKGKP